MFWGEFGSKNQYTLSQLRGFKSEPNAPINFFEILAKSKVKMHINRASKDTNKSSFCVFWEKASPVAAAKPRSRGKGGKGGLRVRQPAEGSGAALARPCVRQRPGWKKARGFPLVFGARTHHHSRMMVPWCGYWGSCWGIYLTIIKFISHVKKKR